MKTIHSLLIFAAFCSCSVFADVILGTVNSMVSTYGDDSITLTAGADSVLLIAATVENTDTSFSAVFDPSGSNQNFIPIVSSTGVGGSATHILGLALGTVTSGTFTIDVTATGSNGGYRVIQVLDADQNFANYASDTDVIADDTTSGVLTNSFTGLGAGSFVYTSYSAEQGGISGTFASSDYDVFGDINGSGAVAGSGYATSVSGSPTFTLDTSSTGLSTGREINMASVAIPTIPEPSSLILLGLSAVSVLLIKRQR